MLSSIVHLEECYHADSGNRNRAKLFIFGYLGSHLFSIDQTSQSQERQQEKFSYLIISRSNEEKTLKNESFDMGRLTAQVRRRPRHVQCQLCCSDGELKQVAVTARHHGKYDTLSFHQLVNVEFLQLYDLYRFDSFVICFMNMFYLFLFYCPVLQRHVQMCPKQ